MTQSTLTPGDLAILQRAIDEKQKADAVLRFVQSHIASVYEIKSGEGVDPRSGVIVRADRAGEQSSADQDPAG